MRRQHPMRLLRRRWGRMMLVQIIWPERRAVDAETLISWAHDDIANGLHEPTTLDTAYDAIRVLRATGSVTFGAGV